MSCKTVAVGRKPNDFEARCCADLVEDAIYLYITAKGIGGVDLEVELASVRRGVSGRLPWLATPSLGIDPQCSGVGGPARGCHRAGAAVADRVARLGRRQLAEIG